jgi:hypothetical protein
MLRRSALLRERLIQHGSAMDHGSGSGRRRGRVDREPGQTLSIRLYIPLPGPFVWTRDRRTRRRRPSRRTGPAGVWIICVLAGVLAVRSDPVFAAVLFVAAAVWAVLWWVSRR